MTRNRVALERELVDVASRLADDELRVLITIAARAWAGQARYGCLQLARDHRDFRKEALEELIDGTFYLAAGLLSTRGRRR